MLKRMTMIAGLIVTAACGDGPTDPNLPPVVQLDPPAIRAAAVISAVDGQDGPYCPLTWTMEGDSVFYGAGEMQLLDEVGAETSRIDLGIDFVWRGVLHLRYDIYQFASVRFSVPFNQKGVSGVVQHTFRCVR